MNYSTISYNTEPFLSRVLSELKDKGTIQEYSFIFHIGEGTDKDHFHVFMSDIKPRTDKSALRNYFNEIDLHNPKPLSVMPFVTSDFPNWYLYSVHNEEYLLRKHEVKEYYYSPEDFRYSDELWFNNMVSSIHDDESDTKFVFEYIRKYGIEQAFLKGVCDYKTLQAYRTILDIQRRENNRKEYDFLKKSVGRKDDDKFYQERATALLEGDVDDGYIDIQKEVFDEK